MEWTKIEPILRKTYALIEENGGTDGESVRVAMGLDDSDARRASYQSVHSG
jgi:hypothetical protein